MSERAQAVWLVGIFALICIVAMIAEVVAEIGL